MTPGRVTTVFGDQIGNMGNFFISLVKNRARNSVLLQNLWNISVSDLFAAQGQPPGFSVPAVYIEEGVKPNGRLGLKLLKNSLLFAENPYSCDAKLSCEKVKK